ncbi:MAG: hypothetical protein HeimC3_31160 [Candidatus Heimdallarchaeota archaeon LC_3]|nr:MAG: hypothetical protein HeimC3_31160 [Candidatus Heimdallarchaeota archaeon LC_3]
MIIYAVYIISVQGKILISENFHSPEEIPNELILGGLITALSGVANELGRSEMKSIEIEGLSYHFRSFGLYRVVLVTDVPTRPESVLQTVGLRFMNKYGEKIDSGKLDNNELIEFKKSIYEIVGKEYYSDESKLIKPTKKFSTGEIFNLPHHLQSTALAMISIEEGTIEEIARESGLKSGEVNENLISLQNLGYIGNRKKDGMIKYFCSSV